MNAKSLADMRISYDLATLGDNDISPDPIALFSHWFEEVAATSVIEANAVVLATVDVNNVPQARTVLMKSFDEDGIVIYTNYDSAKGQQIAANPNVCGLFYWPTLQRQVRWTGVASRVSAEESDAYFAVRPRGSQLGAIASDQSQPIASADVLRQRFDEIEHEYPDGQPIPRPENWGGFRIKPTRIEFWQGRENRLHDRILYTRDETGEWTTSRLAP
ncbi:MAG: pyridoxamine 5'-phosphate oxidase [Thermomicrobiales bacterium]|nr:pyridoxamine 5'-phosphate oxidase [Thermomicrobiales bacterium]